MAGDEKGQRRWVKLVIAVLQSEELRNWCGEWKQGVEAVLTVLFILAERWGDGWSGKRSQRLLGSDFDSMVSVEERNRGEAP
jgi:hypothetical protein